MGFDIKNISLNKKIRSGLGFALLILAFTSTISYYSIYTLIEKSTLVDNTNEILIKLENIISCVSDAESGVRGYVITNHSDYIELYELNKRKSNELFEELKGVSTTNTGYFTKLDSLEIALKKVFSNLDVVIRLHSSNSDKNLFFAFKDGKKSMDQLKVITAEIKQYQQNVLKERVTSVENFNGITPFIIIISSLISLVIAALSFYYINRDLASKAQAQEELESLNNQLNNTNRHLTANKNELFKRNYLLSGVMEINDLMRGENEIGGLCNKIIKHVCNFMNAATGTFYVLGIDGNYHLVACYGIAENNNLQKLIRPDENILGQVSMDRKLKILDNVSTKHLRIESSLISQKSFQGLIVPFHYNELTVGILEMASKDAFEPLDLEYIEALNDSIAIVIHRINAEIQTIKLLQQTQAQSLELEIQQKELKEKNEELIEQQHRLIASEEELRANEEELQEKNAELEEKANELEEQYEEVRLKNIELEEAKDAIKLQMEQLQSVSKYKSEFLSNMSHELRTPLNSILILSKILKDNNDKNLNVKQIEHAEVIEKSGNDLLKLINEILDLARIESGKIKLEPQSVRLMDLGIEGQFSALAIQKNIKFKIIYGVNLPEYVFTDKFRLEQILKNLLSNAFKFTPEGGEVKLEIFIVEEKVKFKRTELQNEHVVGFKITDTGIGIAKEKQELIFEAFQQADSSTTRKYGGTGLGLSISKELTYLLGGEIQVESEINKGSEFTLFLPIIYTSDVQEMNHAYTDTLQLKKDKSNIVSEIKNISETPLLKSNGIQRKILLIEDDIYFKKIVQDFAHEKNYHVLVSGSGEEGLEIAKKEIPDAILLDIQLPGMTGWEVLSAIKADEYLKDIPVHIMSAYDKEYLSQETENAEFIQKPVTLEILDTVFTQIELDINRRIKSVLIIEDNKVENTAIKELLLTQKLSAVSVHNGRQALDELIDQTFDCIILDINLPDIDGFELLENIKSQRNLRDLPVIIYSGKDLSEKEEARLKKHANTIIIKTEYSYIRLLEEIKLFLHNVVQNDNPSSAIPTYSQTESLLNGKKVLVVDDDIRNIYALNNVLEQAGMEILVAYDGLQALEELNQNEDINVILMDMMMPEMDGLQAIKHIRENPKYKNLPIIALTAKAMKGDKEKCIDSGASDYISKPVDVDKLLSLLRVWLYN